jgi:hypothetical protein
VFVLRITQNVIQSKNDVKRHLFILGFQGTLMLGHAAATEKPWSFEPLQVQPLPRIKQADWPQARLDHFILARMEAKNLQPEKPA